MMKKLCFLMCFSAISAAAYAQKNDIPTLVETFEASNDDELFFEQHDKMQFYYTEVFIQDFDTELQLEELETRSWDANTYIPILEQTPLVGSVVTVNHPSPCVDTPYELVKIQRYIYAPATEYSTITIHKTTPDARKTIRSLQQEINKGEPFGIVAAQHSEDAYKDNGGRFPKARVEGSTLTDLDDILKSKEGSLKLMETDDAFVLVQIDAHVQVPIGVYALRFPLDVSVDIPDDCP